MNKLLILPILMFLGNYLLAQESEPAHAIEPPQNVGQNVGHDPGAMGGKRGVLMVLPNGAITRGWQTLMYLQSNLAAFQAKKKES